MYRRHFATYNKLPVCNACRRKLIWFERFRYNILYTVEDKSNPWH